MTNVSELVAALNGNKGDLDDWLECNNEATVRAAIEALVLDTVEKCANKAKDTMQRRVNSDFNWCCGCSTNRKSCCRFNKHYRNKYVTITCYRYLIEWERN